MSIRIGATIHHYINTIYNRSWVPKSTQMPNSKRSWQHLRFFKSTLTIIFAMMHNFHCFIDMIVKLNISISYTHVYHGVNFPGVVLHRPVPIHPSQLLIRQSTTSSLYRFHWGIHLLMISSYGTCFIYAADPLYPSRYTESLVTCSIIRFSTNLKKYIYRTNFF